MEWRQYTAYAADLQHSEVYLSCSPSRTDEGGPRMFYGADGSSPANAVWGAWREFRRVGLSPKGFPV